MDLARLGLNRILGPAYRNFIDITEDLVHDNFGSDSVVWPVLRMTARASGDSTVV
jgi:hypothetical protein